MTTAAVDIAVNTVLDIQNVTRTYPGQPPIEALGGVSLQVREGEMLAVMGPSGSGKSTLLNVIGTLDRPTSGTVTIDGTDTSKLSDRKLSALRSTRVGFVFQSFHLIETVSVLENVAIGLLYQGVSNRLRKERAAKALELVGLGDRLSTRPTKLSGGQRQRVAIARAIVSEPAIVLADEPTGNLDSKTSDEILKVLLELNSKGSTIVVITHDHDVAERLPRSVVMSDGLIVSDSEALAV